MSQRYFRTAVLLAASWLAAPQAARAQLYSWRDSGGTLVVSNKPSGAETRTFEVRKGDAYRATRAPRLSNTDLYDQLIQEHATENAVNPSLVRAVIQAESGFDPFARSNKGAMGLMQLMPATATQYGVANPYDAGENIRAGVAYLRHLLSRYGDNVTLALAAYNAGPGAVERYGSVPPYRETREYVARVRSRAGAEGPPVTHITRSVEVIDGREVVRYTNRVTSSFKR